MTERGGKKAKTLYYLDLNMGGGGGHAERFTPSRLKPNTELETLRILQRAAGDKKLSGVFINLSGFSANRAYLWELGEALRACKTAGKKTAAYFDTADLDLYALASGADRVIMDAAGMLNLQGYVWGRFFARESLEKLGVGFRELRYLDYKSANETFTRTTLSEADREQYGAYLDEIFALAKETITRNRSLSEDSFNEILREGFLLSPAGALERTLVDALGREEAANEAISAMEFPDGEKGEIEFISAGNSAASFFNHNQKGSRYAPRKARRPGTPEIAVVHARGTTDLDSGMAARGISRLIRELAEKRRIKALVLRIESPGGSAVAADYIAEALTAAKKEVPVVVSMGQVAASGGYWAAMYANSVIAAPCTLTGSIGVIGGWLFDKGLNAKLGLGYEALTRGEHAGLGAGMLLPARDLTEEEEGKFRETILALYSEFVRKAAEGRKMQREDMEKLARGRVYSGAAAQKLGLVDRSGGYLDALETARKLAELPEGKRFRVREYPRPSLYQNMAARFFSSVLPGAGNTAAGGTLFGGPGAALPGLVNRGPVFTGGVRLPETLAFRLVHNGKALPLLPF